MEKTHTPTLPREIDVDLHLTDPQRYRVRQGTDGNQRDLAYALAARYNAHSALVEALHCALKLYRAAITPDVFEDHASRPDEFPELAQIFDALKAAGVEL